MNYSKYVFILFSLFLFFACGNDGSEGTIRYIESEDIKSYIVYVGSKNGGVELPSDSIKNRLDIIFPVSIFEDHKNTSISFLDEQTLLIEQNRAPSELNKYTFQDGSIYLYNSDKLIYFGDGDATQLSIRQHYIAYKQSGSDNYTVIQGEPKKTVSKEDIAVQSPFSTIENMSSIGDTLIWCTKASSFR